ncbi:peptidylprolyl isomerase [Azospirillum halopraeferens]|uniref:peptidylprolyl isomerase n=1 Tax=Azospirillum halopraeferens TaxID=34010 RepID=UPI0004279C63|nr:peptidylprolyl isomerase [Azospirillum halopraeferens]
MLQSIRSFAGSWVIKILFALLIASFAVWGIGDVFRGAGPSETVVSIGPVDIGRGELDREVRRQMERLRPLFGGSLTLGQAQQFGLVDQAVSGLVQRTLYDLAARDAGIHVGTDVVRRRIAEEPAFRNEFGQFDPNVFRAVLRQNNLGEDEYIAILRQEIARGLVAGAVAGGAVAPQPLVADLYRHREERRVAEVITLPNAVAGDVGQPDEAAVQAYYEAHPVRFTAPEYRAITIARLELDDLAREITVSDNDLRAEYEDQAHEFRTPERRSLEIVLLEDEAAATAMAEAVAAGTPFDEAARAAGTEPLPLDGVTRDELPEIGDAAFALAEGAVSAPVRSGLGWHLIRVTGVREGSTRSFEEVREELLTRIRRERAADLMFEVSNRLEDALAGGRPLEETARAEGLTLTRVEAVDATGRSPAGEPVGGIDELQDILQVAFRQPAGQTSGLTETRSRNFFAVRTDSVTPPALRPLDAVRDEVVAGWQAEEQARRAAAIADGIAEQLRAGTGADVRQLAEEAGGSVAVTAPFTRQAQSVEGLTPNLIAQLFTVDPGAVVVGTADDARVVARLTGVTPADPAAAGTALAPVEDDVARAIEGDLMVQFAEALRVDYPVSMFPDRIRQMYPAD